MIEWIEDRVTPRRRIERAEALNSVTARQAHDVAKRTDELTKRKARARALGIYIDAIGPRDDR
jgi:hypothetical protein